MGLGREEIVSQLRQVKLPRESGLQGDLVSADLVRALSVTDGKVSFVIEAPSPQAAAHLAGTRDQAQAVLQNLPGVQTVSVVLTAHGPAPSSAPSSAPPDLKPRQPAPPQRQGIAGVGHIIAVGSGKGGVGKSTVTSNLAVALARQGLRVGLLDADLYGPSQPRMLGAQQRPDLTADNRLVPLLAHGVKMMSIGLLVEADQPLAWRGAMLNKALQQLLNDVEWGALDVLLIDLPPGTGDVQLTLGQKIDLTGALIVSTPQDVALIDATRAISMFQKFDTPVLGLVENMSSYICPNCQHEAHIFGHGGVRNEAERLGVPYLGELPLDLEVRLGGDNGVPVAAGQGPLAEAYARLARHLLDKGLI